MAAACAATFGDVPRPVPVWALRHEIVWRLEVFLATLLILYVPFTLVVLAFHGWLFTAVNADSTGGGGQAEQITDLEQTDALSDLRAAVDGLRSSLGEGLQDLGARVRDVEDQLRLKAPHHTDVGPAAGREHRE